MKKLFNRRKGKPSGEELANIGESADKDEAVSEASENDLKDAEKAGLADDAAKPEDSPEPDADVSDEASEVKEEEKADKAQSGTDEGLEAEQSGMAEDMASVRENPEVDDEEKQADTQANEGEEQTDSQEADETLSWEENRRAYRHKRRIRNQIIAYCVVAALLAALVGAGVVVVHSVSGIIAKNKIEKQQAEEELVKQESEEDILAEPDEKVVETPVEIEEATLDEQLEEVVNNCISVMPLNDKIAGLFIITPEALTGVGTAVQAGEGTQEALSEYAVGGLIYSANNIRDEEQLSQMLSNTVSMSKYPIFLAVEEEGGETSCVANSSVSVAQVDDMRSIGEAGDTGAAYEAGVTIGAYLNRLGFNLDLAPVADIAAQTGNSYLGNRSFGKEASLCADMAANVTEGIQGNSVSACLKYFPCIDGTDGDVNEGRAETTKTLEEMREADFLPFEAGIKAGADFVMVGHITASAVDGEGVPSSLSKTIITDVLRTELGFEGVVITDKLNMSAISDYYTSEEAAVNAVMAGADMLLMPENFEEAYNGLLAAVQEGRISEERIDESLRRIYRIKYADKLK